MKPKLDLKSLLSTVDDPTQDRLAVFAMVNLGIVESLANGLMSAMDAVRIFFHADNCLYVRKQLKEPAADRIMSHGVQLPDLFDGMPPEKAQREFLHELAVMKTLCLKLIEDKQLVA